MGSENPIYPIENISISTTDIKAKLSNLHDYSDCEVAVVYMFAKYLASRLNPKLVPFGFAYSYHSALQDIAAPENDPKTPETLTGYHPAVYELISSRMIPVTKAVCPSDFADAVEREYLKYCKK